MALFRALALLAALTWAAPVMPVCGPSRDRRVPGKGRRRARRSGGKLTLSPVRRLASLACDAPGGHLQAVMGGVTTASLAHRQVEGLIIPWNRYGNTSTGRLAARPGSIRLPQELSRVKIVDDHQRPPVSVGYLLAAWATDEGLWGRFQLDRTDRASQLLHAMEDKSKDGLSVELDDLVVDGSVLTDSLLTAVAAVAIPAFTDARVTNLAASLTNGDNMDPCTTCGHRHALEASCPGPALTATSPTWVPAPGATSPAPGPAGPPAPQPQEPQPQPQPQPQEPQPSPTEPAQPQAQAGAWAWVPAPSAPAASAPAAAPAMLAGLTGTAPAANTAEHDAEVYAALARVMTGQSRHPAMEAALADIVNTNVYDVVGQESYVGRLWSGNTYTRRFIPLLRPGRLTSWKVRGWRWDVKPEVFDYAGDKAAVPTNTPTVVPAETEAARLAGGHDLDRKFRDFGDTEFLSAYFAAMTESYAKKSDAKALAFILATATANTATPTAAGANLVQAVLEAGNALSVAFDDEEIEADYYLVNRADRMALMNVTNNEAPAYAASLGLEWSKIKPAASVPAGTVVAGIRSAGTFYELGESPIRVEALDIARGGVDEAVFGYYATLLHDTRGIQRVTMTPAV